MSFHGAKKIVRVNVADLKPHPRQGAVFSKATERQVQELAADLMQNGQMHPIEILLDHTIIAGHTRVTAAQTLGWEQIDAWVREDLEGDDAAVEKRLIDDNLNRRQLGQMAMARAYKRLKQLASGRRTPRLTVGETKELRDQIGERLNCSGRTLDRYLHVLNCTPQEVQDAVEAGTLPLTTAEKVAGLDKNVREEIGGEIRDCKAPKAVAARFLAAAPPKRRRPYEELERFVQSLGRAVVGLNGRVGELRPIGRGPARILAEGGQLIRQLLKHAKKVVGPE